MNISEWKVLAIDATNTLNSHLQLPADWKEVLCDVHYRNGNGTFTLQGNKLDNSIAKQKNITDKAFTPRVQRQDNVVSLSRKQKSILMMRI